MTVENYIAFNIALIAAIASPGPALLIAIRTTLSTGRKAGIAIGCGLGLMAATWTLMALCGLEIVFELFPLAYTGAKIIGAVYLMYIAWGMWRGANSPIKTQTQPAKRVFRQGFMLNLLNPKSVLFSAAVLIIIFPENMNITENTLVVLNHLFIEVIFYTGLAFTMSTETVSRHYLKTKVYMDRFASIVLSALGLKILVDIETN